MSGKTAHKEVTVPVEITWKGEDLVEAKIRDFNFLMDTPPFVIEDKKSLGPSATETFLAALGRCNVVSIMKAAKDEGVKIEGLKAKLEGKLRVKEPSETGFKIPVWRFNDVLINLEITTDADEKQVARVLDESHKYCTVCNAVEERISGRFSNIKIKKP